MECAQHIERVVIGMSGNLICEKKGNIHVEVETIKRKFDVVENDTKQIKRKLTEINMLLQCLTPNVGTT